jgi:DNA-binding response OmpR family regulator
MTTPRVLVVEDDPSVRGLLQTLFVAEGYDVGVAADGLGGLLDAAAHKPDLIVLDMVMPDLGGIRVLEEMRGDPALSGVPVIVVTGKQESVPGLRDLLGDDNVFTKPFPVGDLLNRVGVVTGGAAPDVHLPD